MFRRIKMPIFEENTNYPTVLGKLNRPLEILRTGGIGSAAMAMVRGEPPVHLAQIFNGQLLNGARIRQVLTVRKTPMLDTIRARVRGQVALIDSMGRNIPQPYVRTTWGPYQNIGQIPAVISDISGASGPRRTIHPMKQNFSVEL